MLDIFFAHKTSFVVIFCGTNNVDQNQQKNILVGILKIVKIFTKKHSKINTIITGMFPRDKTYSFRRTKIDETNQILKAERKNLPKTYFVEQDETGSRAIWYYMKTFNTKTFFT